jgi:hypothetical protein
MSKVQLKRQRNLIENLEKKRLTEQCVMEEDRFIINPTAKTIERPAFEQRVQVNL